MAVNTTGITPAASFLPTIWATRVSDATQAATVLADRVDRSYEAEMSFGRVLQINDMTNPPVRQKSQDTTATWDNRTESNQQLTIDKQVYCARLFENQMRFRLEQPTRGLAVAA